MIDLHCHILPGVDDGSADEAESLAMLEAAKKAGVTKIVCTPHYKSRSYSEDDVEDAFEWFGNEAISRGVEAYLGYEIHWKKIMELGIDTVLDHTIADTDFALVEFSFGHDIGQLELRTLWKLKGKGITPILAHPERYASIQKNYDLAHDLKNGGCLFQLSADAVVASMFSARKKAYKYLLKNGKYDYIASDAHCVDDYEDFMKAIKQAPEVVEAQMDFLIE